MPTQTSKTASRRTGAWAYGLCLLCVTVFPLLVVLHSYRDTNKVRHFMMMDSSGRRLHGFFEGLPTGPNGSMLASMHGKVVQRCRQDSNVISWIINRVLESPNVVYAQSNCPVNTECTGALGWCGSVRVTMTPCTECGDSWRYDSVWQFDGSAQQISIGYKDTSNVKCGNSNCGCNVNECSCMGG